MGSVGERYEQRGRHVETAGQVRHAVLDVGDECRAIVAKGGIDQRALGRAWRERIGPELVQAEAGGGLEPAVSWVVLEKQRAASAGCLDGEAM